MPSKHDKTKRAYHFFLEAEQAKRGFTLEEVAAVSGWSLGTTRTYRTKKWHFFIQELDGVFTCPGITNISEDAFIRIHAQRTDVGNDILRPRFTPEVDALIDKCREAALLAVQVYNNPLVAFRTPGYIVQMIIAHTALFHAIFERNGTEYWYLNPDGTAKEIDGDKFAWDISECVRFYTQGNITPQSENVKFFINIRNKIEHRFIPALDITFSGKCQALLMNFESLLVSEFGGFFSLGISLALALQFSVFAEDQQKALRRIQSKEYEVIRKYSDAYDANLPDDITQSMLYSFRAFLIPKVGNHAKSSDAAIEFIKYDQNNPDEMEKYEKQVAFIKEKQVRVPVADQGKLKPSDVVKFVTEMTGIRFTLDHHTRAWKLYQVRPQRRIPEGCRIEYCQFNEAFEQFVYTQEWVAFLAAKVLNPDEFERIKAYRTSNKEYVEVPH
jgi:hypothetical protein